ncbi:hypothetical protein KAT63_04795 [Candidatus Parcubacteria bacterium]|nr:hypothetical protein [Candidatus Parcubacteria bacterium]
MEQNIQPSENSVEIKLDGEGEPISPKSEKKINKKIILLIIIMLIIVSGAVYFLFLNKEDNDKLPVEENAEVLEDKKEVEIDKELDTDQDGLPDYLEKIIGTDINNSDTDGDSYSDFEEIKNGYNPLDDKKFTEEEWGVVKEEVRNENYEYFIKNFINKINCEYKKGEYELRYYDSSGRVTGMVNGEMKEEIPNFNSSEYEGLNMGLIPQDVDIYEIFGIKEGNYRLNVIGSDGENLIGFSATNIPIFPGETHRYELDRDTIYEEGMGAIFSIDIDGDNDFEREINVDSNFTCEEFILQI